MSNLLEQASLVMIPSGYAEDIVYSEIPIDGAGDLSFTRASDGTRVNSAGLVEVVPWNFVEQSSNLGSWSNAGVTITTGITDAYGTTNAVTMSNISIGSNTDYIVKYNNAMALPTGTQINYSVYLKGSGTIGVIIERSVSGDYFYQQQGVTLTNAWVRYDFAFTIGVGVNANGISFYVSNLTGTTATSVDICFPQINYGSTAKNYFPTTDRLNVPRLTYQNGGGGCPSLLLEKQSTNLALYSEQFDNAGWVKLNVTVSANATTSPDGTINADKLIADSGYSSKAIYQGIAPAGVSTATIYAKAGEFGGIAIATGTMGAFFNLTNGTYRTSYVSAPTNYAIESVGNGWYKCSVTFTLASTDNFYIGPNDNSSNTFAVTGNGTDGIFLWGMQMEASSYPTSYIPTTSASATRVADTCYRNSYAGGITSEGTIFADFEYLRTDGGYSTPCLIYNGGLGNYIYLTVLNNSIRAICANSAVAQSNIISSTVTPNTRYKVAARFKTNDFSLYVNGALIGTDTSGTMPTFSTSYDTYIGTDASFTEPVGKLNELVIFPVGLTNAELASLTTI